MSVEAFRDIVNYLKKREKVNLVQQLVINLNLSEIDAGMMISLCLEYKLFTSLIYISTRGEDKDYITPIVKMYAEFLKKQN